MSLDDLIKRLEAATEGSRELDMAIELATHPLYAPFESVCMVWHGDPKSHRQASHIVPFYTTSIDAALTLIPEGYAILYLQIWPGQPTVLTLYGTRREKFGASAELDYVHHVEDGRWQVEARTTALALCIGALRAKAAEVSR